MNIKRIWQKMDKSKGYYLALFLCAVAIGTASYVYQRNARETVEVGEAKATVQASKTDSVPAMATDGRTVATQKVESIEEIKPVEKQLMKTAAPLSGQTIGEFAVDCLSYNETTRDWRIHRGVDLAAEIGAEVHAAAEGVVESIHEDDSMGTTVVIRHQDGYKTKYCSLGEKPAVSVGDSVALGQTIGNVDNSALMENAIGAHLHFEVTQNDVQVDPSAFCDLG